MTERRMRFVSAVTHELRTPLTSFQLYSDLLADMPTEDAARRVRYAGALRTEAKRLARLVENVLAYSRIGDARPRLHVRMVSPQDVLDALASGMFDRCAADGRRLVLENKCPSTMTIETDVDMVLQILSNLVENACKYGVSGADSSIWVSARDDPEGVCFEVEDAGPGVPARDRRAVFEPFRRSDAGGNGATTGGVGLGLAMSRHWAECLGGRLTLRRGRRNPHALACFVLSLPQAVRT